VPPLRSRVAGYSYTGVKGLNALIAIVSTPIAVGGRHLSHGPQAPNSERVQG